MDFSLIGLSGRDKRVYEALIAEPQASVRKIADSTGINRGSVFESLKALRQAGLVTSITLVKRPVYRAKDPEVIHEIIREKQHELEQANDTLDHYVQSFAGRANDASLFHFASFYQDDEGLAMILRDVLKTCRRNDIHEYRAISSPKVSAYLYNNFPHFTRERVRAQLHVQVLRQGRALREEAAYADSRQLQVTASDTGCYTLIYGQKVAIIMIDDGNQTSGVIIDNRHFAAIEARLFDESWRQAAA